MVLQKTNEDINKGLKTHLYDNGEKIVLNKKDNSFYRSMFLQLR